MSIILNLVIKHGLRAPEKGRQTMIAFEAWGEVFIVKVIYIACSLWLIAHDLLQFSFIFFDQFIVLAFHAQGPCLLCRSCNNYIGAYGGNYQNHITFHNVPVCHAYQMQLIIIEPLQCCKWALGINWLASTWGCIINGSFKHSHPACKSLQNLEICWHISRWKTKSKNATIFKWAIPSPHARHQLNYSPSSSLDWDYWLGYFSKMTSSTRLSNWSTIT